MCFLKKNTVHLCFWKQTKSQNSMFSKFAKVYFLKNGSGGYWWNVVSLHSWHFTNARMREMKKTTIKTRVCRTTPFSHWPFLGCIYSWLGEFSPTKTILTPKRVGAGPESSWHVIFPFRYFLDDDLHDTFFFKRPRFKELVGSGPRFGA